MRISDWSSDVCSSYLIPPAILKFIDRLHQADIALLDKIQKLKAAIGVFLGDGNDETKVRLNHFLFGDPRFPFALLHHVDDAAEFGKRHAGGLRSEEHPSELQSLMRISYAVFRFKKKKHKIPE